jgi:gluconate 2-dehydrogenase gamma chain
MTKHNEARRAFLVGAAASAGAVAGVTLLPEARAQMPMAPAAPGDSAPSQADMHGKGTGDYAFFNDTDAATVAALTERIMPDAPGKPGAREAGVLNYIDLALAGPYADLREFYRHGLVQLEAHCREAYKRSFVGLDAAHQDEVVGALASGKAAGFAWPSAQAFFNTLRTHTMEGMFGDPVYGGNKDFAGWRLAGFPGAQMQFTADDMKSPEAFTREPVMGLQAQGKPLSRRS